jgi:Uma2 family endonuclease
MTPAIQIPSPPLPPAAAAQPQQSNPFVFPYSMPWNEFLALELALESRRSIRLSYLDGHVELMPTSTDHEIFKCLLAGLLILFFMEKDLDFMPTGSATLMAEEKGASKEPDLSYRFGENRRQKEVPDLVIEIVFTSGDARKLEYYRRFEIAEIWFWEDGVFSLYQLQADRYEKVDRSQWLPGLDFGLLSQCLQMTEEKEALKVFRAAIQSPAIER